MTTDEYVPNEQDLEVAWIESEASADDIDVASAEFDRFLARVRRDAAREALLALDQRLEPLGAYQDADGIWTAQGEIADMLATDYPKEAP